MRILQLDETNTVAGAGLLDVASQPIALVAREVNKHLTVVMDPARGTATLNTPLGSKALKLPAAVMSLGVSVLTLLG